MSESTYDQREEVQRLHERIAELERALGESQAAAEELRRKDAALRESEERYRALFENAPTGLGVASLDGTLLRFNRAMLEPGGYTEEDARQIGNVAQFYYDPADREEALAITRQQGYLRQHEVRFRKQDGGAYHALLSLSPIVVDGHRGWLAMVQDISRRKQAEDALKKAHQELEARVDDRTANLQAANERLEREIQARAEVEASLRNSESQWRTLVQNAPDMILTVNRGGTILFLNRTQTGEDPSAAVGTSVFGLITEEDRERLNGYYHTVFDLGQSVIYEMSANIPGLGVHWYEARMGPIVRDGRIDTAIAITTDITERRLAQDALRDEQQLLKQLLKQQEVDRQLISYEIHDGLVQYITGALMRLEALSEDVEFPPQQLAVNFNPAIHLLRDSIREARRLITGLRPPILDEGGIVPSIYYLIGEQGAGRTIEFLPQVQDARFAPAVESALFRICQEALTNAVRHSQARHIEIELVQHDGQVALVIRDTGVGFDLRRPAKGFGLQGIRERARLMGGCATIESAPGKGTTIQVELPLEAPL